MADNEQDNVRTASSLEEASALLGITPEAVRKRLKRGTLEGYKDKSGKWQVYIPDKEPDSVRTKQDNVRTASREIELLEARIEDLQKHNDILTKALERRDFIVAIQEQKILELEAPKEESWLKRIFRR